LDAAAKAFEKGDRPKAIALLEAGAIEDPECFEIASNLGALYLKLQSPERALPWLEKARSIDPDDSPNNTNLSAYYAFKDDYPKVEAFAAASLRVNPNSTHARFMLAVALLKQGKSTELARTHLGQIQDEFIPARNLLQALRAKE
jgi:tetratricopeptide (TPR) repeat protein